MSELYQSLSEFISPTGLDQFVDSNQKLYDLSFSLKDTKPDYFRFTWMGISRSPSFHYFSSYFLECLHFCNGKSNYYYFVFQKGILRSTNHRTRVAGSPTCHTQLPLGYLVLQISLGIITGRNEVGPR